MRRIVQILGIVTALTVGATTAWAISPCCKAFQGACADPSVGFGPRGCQELDDGNCVGGGVFTNPDTGAPDFAGCICLTLPPPQVPGCITDVSTRDWLQGRRGDPSTGKRNPETGDPKCTAAAERACQGFLPNQ